MLRIDSITPGARTLLGEPAYEVTYSLTPGNRSQVRWLVALVPEKYSLVEVDWLLRNHWAQRPETPQLNESDLTTLPEAPRHYDWAPNRTSDFDHT